jgi:hypothetical protein
MIDQPFTAVDDDLHVPSTDFYETETFWFSFFVPERALGAWLRWAGGCMPRPTPPAG